MLYLAFNEGYASTDADSLIRPDLAREAIRLARLAVELLPRSMEARGLLALMLLTDARREGRISEGELVPLEHQDRALWNTPQIEEGVGVLDAALARGEPGPYQVQAAIAALHATAPAAADTDWPQIALLYDTLQRWLPTPIVELNAAVAHGMTGDLECALDRIRRIEAQGALVRYHLLPASKAEILRRLGHNAAAADAYRHALALVTNPVERRHLQRRLDEILMMAIG